MRVYKPTLIKLRIWGCEGTRIQASTHEPQDMRIQGCKQGIRNWRYEDVSMHGCKQVHRNIRIRGCEDAGIQASAQEPKDMSMWGCKYI